LTTVHQPFRRIGMSVMESFLSMLGQAQGQRTFPQVVLKARLVERGSTGPAPAER
jgi:DNA-binding LacI/PurR family transcriptional regulator